MFDELREVRIQKLHELREAGINPYAERYPRTHSLREAYTLGDGFEGDDQGDPVSVAGRVLTIRSFGKLTFLHLQDGSGRCQVALDTRVVGKESMDLFKRVVDMGDHIGVEGKPGKTRKGEPTVFGTAWTFLSNALRPLP